MQPGQHHDRLPVGDREHPVDPERGAHVGLVAHQRLCFRAVDALADILDVGEPLHAQELIGDILRRVANHRKLAVADQADPVGLGRRLGRGLAGVQPDPAGQADRRQSPRDFRRFQPVSRPCMTISTRAPRTGRSVGPREPASAIQVLFSAPLAQSRTATPSTCGRTRPRAAVGARYRMVVVCHGATAPGQNARPAPGCAG